MDDHGRYDYNHSTTGHQFIVIIPSIMILGLVLGGLFIGLNIIDRL